MASLENAFALVVGIATYPHASSLPPSVAQDAEDIRDVLVDPNLGGYRPEHVILLQNEQATGDAIRHELARLAGCAAEEATVFLYLTSHGGRVPAGSYAGEYLLPTDVDISSDEALARSAISGDELTHALEAVRARKMVVVFDCCHAGGLGQPKSTAAATFAPGLSDGYYERLQAGRGRVVLASSRSTEYSYVLPGMRNSLFTHHLLDGLRGGVVSDDGLVRIFDLFEFVQPRVTADWRDQHPLFKAVLEENFPIAQFRGGQPGVVARDVQGFRYDAYVTFADAEPDYSWVWQVLLPRLERAGLRVAVSGDVEEPGVARVVGVERAIRKARRTIVVLSEAYLADRLAEFQGILTQSMDVEEGTHRLLPIKIAPLPAGRLPTRLSMLVALDLTRPQRLEREFERLTRALAQPLPGR
jgi:hypothetical protein